jgi:hypothetical protein
MPNPSLFLAEPLDAPQRRPRQRPPRMKPRTWPPPTDLERLLERSPQLHAVGRPLRQLLQLPAIRDDADWTPAGRSPFSVFVSLAQHRTALFPLPVFMWSVFFERPRLVPIFLPLVVAAGRGESLFDFTHAGDFPVPLTRPQCHALRASPPERPFFEALRRAQALRLPAWMTEELLLTEWGRELFRPGIEAQWTTWVDWLATRTDVRPGQLGPLSDFVVERLGAGFVLRGRTAGSLRAAMEAWHEELACQTLAAQPRPRPTPRSGFPGAAWTRERDGVTERWSVEELDSPEALFQEGVAMHHCVFTYLNRVLAGTGSIWSLGRHNVQGRTRQVTLQVRNAEREIVQMRGPCNRAPTDDELALIKHWAAQAGLSVAGAFVL